MAFEIQQLLAGSQGETENDGTNNSNYWQAAEIIAELLVDLLYNFTFVVDFLYSPRQFCVSGTRISTVHS